MIVAVLMAENRDDLERRAARVRPLLSASRDAFEVRLDAAARPEDLLPLPDLGLPILATLRQESDGGRHRGTPDQRRELLGQALAGGARWVDVEGDLLDHALTTLPASHVLVSWHHFDGVPDSLEADVGAALARGVFGAKVAAGGGEFSLARRLIRLVRTHGGRVTAFGLGPGLAATRWLHRRLQAPIVYAHTEGVGAASPAPGLPALEDLLEVFLPGGEGPADRVLGVLAATPEHSMGPLVWGRILRGLEPTGLRASYVPLGASDLRDLRPLLDDLGIDGLSVTIPHKEAVLALAKEVDPIAARVGAANTLVRRPTGFLALNTDVAGVRDPVARRLAEAPAPGPVALIAGAGGAARGAVVALEALGLDVRIRGRRPEAAASLAEEFGLKREAPRPEEVGVVVNATPLGRDAAEQELPVPATFLQPDGGGAGHGLWRHEDPPPAGRRDRRSACHHGAGDVRGPGSRAGEVVPPRPGRHAKGLRGRGAMGSLPPGLVLIGQRRAGKTTVARALAQDLGVEAHDLDALITAKTGRTPAEWLTQDGEAAFRCAEAESLAAFTPERPFVLATGGGAPLQPGAEVALRRLGSLLWLAVPPEELRRRRAEDDGRPLLVGNSAEEELVRTFREREAGYARMADHRIDGTGTLAMVVARCREHWPSA